MRVGLFLLLIIIPRFAKQGKIHRQPPCNLGDQLCKILAHKTEIMKVLHHKLYSKFLENGSDDAVQLQDIDLIELVLGWSHAGGLQN
jgi:hypothetical protein